jgi:XTP/dITP diphosphohydrolase
VTVCCATGNPGKLREFRLAAAQAGVQVETLPGLAEMPPCKETGDTFEANAILKAEYYGRHASGLLFADDSGLEVDALGGAPGVYSARFAGPGATDEANNQLLLERMRGIRNRSARFVCVIALVDCGHLQAVFRSTVEGQILEEPRGSNGFGYDPLFYWAPFGCSFGEVAPELKLTVSHRGAALRSLFGHLSMRGV